MDSPTWRWEIPFTHGIQARVIVGGVVASTARAVIETPLEYAKVGLSSNHNTEEPPIKDTLMDDTIATSKQTLN